MASPLILFDYDLSPYGQKIRTLLAATKIEFKHCGQSVLTPRPTLENMSITHRRIPMLAIGKDIYCDSLAIMDKLQEIAGSRALPTGPADSAYEAFGVRTFWNSLRLIPNVTPEFAKERRTIAPILSRPDFRSLRPSALGEFRATLDIVENKFLAQGGQWIGGQKMSVADVHVGLFVRWALIDMGVGREPGFSEKEYPKVYRWFRNFPAPEMEKISDEAATRLILSSDYAVNGMAVDTHDPLGISQGTMVSIETTDSAPGSHPQVGKLVGTGRNELVIELDNGLRLHFPRLGYVVRQAAATKL